MAGWKSRKSSASIHSKSSCARTRYACVPVTGVAMASVLNVACAGRWTNQSGWSRRKRAAHGPRATELSAFHKAVGDSHATNACPVLQILRDIRQLRAECARHVHAPVRVRVSKVLAFKETWAQEAACIATELFVWLRTLAAVAVVRGVLCVPPVSK